MVLAYFMTNVDAIAAWLDHADDIASK